MTYTVHCTGWPQPLDCQTLQKAMASAGHPDPADWLPVLGTPGRIVTEAMPDERTIEAVGVAYELIGMLPAVTCATRVWSAADPAITCAVTTALPDPFVVSATAAARLCAHYAVAGVLSWATIVGTVAGAFGDALAEHARDIDRIAAAVSAALAAFGIPTTQLPATGPAQRIRLRLYVSRNRSRGKVNPLGPR